MTEQAQQHATGDEQTRGDEGQRPVADVFSHFGDELADSLRKEFQQVRDEAGDRARAAAPGAGFPTAAAAPGAVATGAALTLPVLALRKVLGPGATALLLAGGAGG